MIRKCCSDCKYLYRYITDEPCMICSRFNDKFEPREEKDNENNDTAKL